MLPLLFNGGGGGGGGGGGASPGLVAAASNDCASSLRVDLLPVVDAARALLGCPGLDLRTVQVAIVSRTWSGGRVGVGSASDATLTLPGYYRVDEVSSEETSSSGGAYEVQRVRVRITPADGRGVGFTIAQLAPRLTAQGTETVYVLSGAIAGEFAREDLKTDRPFRYELTLRRTRATP